VTRAQGGETFLTAACAGPSRPVVAPGSRVGARWFARSSWKAVRLEERFAVEAFEQEGEAVQIAAELVKAVGGMTVGCLE
jgi:hypothetical protein